MKRKMPKPPNIRPQLRGIVRMFEDSQTQHERLHSMNTQIVALQAELGRVSLLATAALTGHQDETTELRRQLEDHNQAIARLMVDFDRRQKVHHGKARKK